jgi:hypothetical protein
VCLGAVVTGARGLCWLSCAVFYKMPGFVVLFSPGEHC